MDATLAAAGSALLGLVTGAFAVGAFRLSERETRAEAPPTLGEPLPAGSSAILDALHSAAVVLTRDDVVLRASAQAHALGLVQGTRVASQAALDLAHDVAREGDVREAEVEVSRGPIGTGQRLLGVRVAPLPGDLLLLIADDRTEARRIDAVRRDFVANVSHELKTPVGAISLLAEAIGDAAEDPEAVRRFAGRMARESDRLTRLVQEVIDLSRLEWDDPLRTPEVFDLGPVVAEAAERLRERAVTRDIDLVVLPSPEVLVRGDAGQLMTAVRNLVENAVAYSGESTRVTVSLTRSGDIAEVAVTDQGIGIPAGELERIFERFYRVDTARSRATGGTGLGLSIVKHIAANHGGEVTVWSVEGTGSTFTIRLPVVAEAATAIPPPSPGAARPLTRGAAAGPDHTSPEPPVHGAQSGATPHPLAAPQGADLRMRR